MLESKNKFISHYLTEHPDSAATTIAKLDNQAIAKITQTFDPEFLLEVFNRLPAHILSEAFIDIEDSRLVKILSQIQSTLAARILRSWSMNNNSTKSDSIVSQLEPKVARKLRDLINYPDDVIGALMNPTPFTVTPDLSIEEVMEMLKKQKSRYSRYIYVVDADKKLIGVVPFKETFYINQNLLVSETMSSHVYALNAFTGIKTTLNDPAWGKWDSLPIIDSKNKLQGVLKYDVLSNHVYKAQARNELDEDIVSAGRAVGEVLKIGFNATLSVLGSSKDKNS